MKTFISPQTAAQQHKQ